MEGPRWAGEKHWYSGHWREAGLKRPEIPRARECMMRSIRKDSATNSACGRIIISEEIEGPSLCS